MTDKYRNFSDLKNSEREGVDFRIGLRHRLSSVAIIAPHGGNIEKGTSDIVEAIAGACYSLYCFEGMKARRNWMRHITSVRFDEPKCVELVSGCDFVVILHGCKGTDQTIYLGGLDTELREAIRDNLAGAGFTTDAKRSLQGVGPDNICNRGRWWRGVQLEISRGSRIALLKAGSTDGVLRLSNLADAIRRALDARAI